MYAKVFEQFARTFAARERERLRLVNDGNADCFAAKGCQSSGDDPAFVLRIRRATTCMPWRADSMTKALIFDVDGTLVDSVDLHACAWQETFREFGKDIPFSKIRMQIGKGGDQLMPVFLSKSELDEHSEQISERRGKIFKEKYLSKVKGFPLVRELFQRLLADGKKIAIASSAIGEELETYKKVAGIVDLLDAETSADDAARSKPYADIFLAALERLGNPPKGETLVVGDTPYDIEAAGKAGLKTIALRCGGFPDDVLQGAVAIYDDPADLLARYDESPLY
jgi:HAD superfamily hydrolase (TIGR01549 family)